MPLVAKVTAANVNDATQLIPMVDAIPPVAGKRGAPRRRPHAVQTDRGYRSHRNRMALWTRGIKPLIPEHDALHGSGLGATRWVVKRTTAWLRQFRRLGIRYERRGDIDQAFLTLGCILICFRTLDTSSC